MKGGEGGEGLKQDMPSFPPSTCPLLSVQEAKLFLLARNSGPHNAMLAPLRKRRRPPPGLGSARRPLGKVVGSGVLRLERLPGEDSNSRHAPPKPTRGSGRAVRVSRHVQDEVRVPLMLEEETDQDADGEGWSRPRCCCCCRRRRCPRLSPQRLPGRPWSGSSGRRPQHERQR